MSEPFRGQIRKEDVRAVEKDRVEMYRSFRCFYFYVWCFFCILTFRLCMEYLSQAGGHCTSKSDLTGWRRYSKFRHKPLLSLFLLSAADILKPSSNQALATFSLLLRTSSELSLQGGQHFLKQCNFPDVPSVEPNLKKQYFCEEFSFYGQVWGWSSHGTSLMDWDAVSDFNFKRGTKSN